MISELQVASYGPLADLIERGDVTEILINAFDEIWYERDGVLFRHPRSFSSPVSFHNFLQRVCAEARLRPDLETPHADGEWRGFRVHVVQAPLRPAGPCVSLRRRTPRLWTLDHLMAADWTTPAALQILKRKLTEKKSLLIVGPTGSGKTSVLNACLKEFADNERVITIEDTDEIHLANTVSVKLLTREAGMSDLRPYSQADLLRQALRMRPDRIVVGEVRGAEAKDLLLALSTGHGGALATLHAATARQALLRLEMLVQMGAPEWRMETVRQLIHGSLDAILVLNRRNGGRRLEGIYEIASLEETGFCLEKADGTAGPTP